MVVQHNMAAMNASRNLTVTTASQKKSAEKLSSGYRINRAADDAAGLVKSESKRSEIRQIGSSILNQQEKISNIQEAEGSLQEAHNMAQRIVELEERGKSGTDAKAACDAEIASIKTAMTSMINNASVAAGKVTDEAALKTEIDTAKAAVAAGTGNALVKAISDARAKLGYSQNVAEYNLNDMRNRQENLNSTESAIRDTDMASEMVNYTNQNILVQAGQSMISQANQINQGVLSLLQ